MFCAVWFDVSSGCRTSVHGSYAFSYWQSYQNPRRARTYIQDSAKQFPKLIRQLEGGFAQAQGVGDDRHGSEAHGGTGDHWAQQPAEERIENACGKRNPERVVKKGEGKILTDILDRGAAEQPGAHDAAQIALH